ncbi:MAG: HEPN domain-containing protein, partial [Geothrix sp.]|nr:HEPN domain-containing protein [Geothrix sp.]
GKLNQVKYFHNCLWVASDNSIDNELGFLVVKNGNKFQTCSNFIANNFSNAEGLHIPTKLTDDLFNISRKVFNAFIVNKAPGDPSTTNFQKNVPRLYRAHYSIQAARSAPDIAERIAFYCTALETLFSTNSAELSHQLSERTAVFLSNDPETRLEIYKNVKAAYSIRSKSVHGDVIKNTNEQLMETSKSIDEILRACFVTAISNREASQAFDSSNELLDGYMIGLIFGGRRCPAENTES